MSGTPVPGDLAPSFGFHWQLTHMKQRHIHTCSQNTHTHKIKVQFFFSKLVSTYTFALLCMREKYYLSTLLLYTRLHQHEKESLLGCILVLTSDNMGSSSSSTLLKLGAPYRSLISARVLPESIINSYRHKSQFLLLHAFKMNMLFFLQF